MQLFKLCTAFMLPVVEGCPSMSGMPSAGTLCATDGSHFTFSGTYEVTSGTGKYKKARGSGEVSAARQGGPIEAQLTGTLHN